MLIRPLRTCELRIVRIGRCLRLQRRQPLRCGSDEFALFAFRTFARALSGNVQVAAHEVPSTANQVSTLCRPDSVRPARALPSRRSRSSAVEIRDDVAWRENSAEISVRVIPFGLAALRASWIASAMSSPTRIPEDLRRALLAEIPDRECRLQMGRINLGLVIERGIDDREPNYLRLGPAELRRAIRGARLIGRGTLPPIPPWSRASW